MPPSGLRSRPGFSELLPGSQRRHGVGVGQALALLPGRPSVPKCSLLGLVLLKGRSEVVLTM